MTPERAKEILDSGDGFFITRKYTETEFLEVCKLWDTMPGHTCWTDALIRVKNGEEIPK